MLWVQALFPLLCSIKVLAQQEQTQIWTENHAVYILPLLQVPVTREVLWGASKAHANCRRISVQNRFPKWNMTCHDNFSGAGAKDYSKARERRICLPNLGIAVTPSVAQESWIVPGSAHVWDEGFLPFRAPHCSPAVCVRELAMLCSSVLCRNWRKIQILTPCKQNSAV